MWLVVMGSDGRWHGWLGYTLREVQQVHAAGTHMIPRIMDDAGGCMASRRVWKGRLPLSGLTMMPSSLLVALSGVPKPPSSPC
jgi:hypothetical protein